MQDGGSNQDEMEEAEMESRVLTQHVNVVVLRDDEVQDRPLDLIS